MSTSVSAINELVQDIINNTNNWVLNYHNIDNSIEPVREESARFGIPDIKYDTKKKPKKPTKTENKTEAVIRNEICFKHKHGHLVLTVLLEKRGDKVKNKIEVDLTNEGIPEITKMSSYDREHHYLSYTFDDNTFTQDVYDRLNKVVDSYKADAIISQLGQLTLAGVK